MADADKNWTQATLIATRDLTPTVREFTLDFGEPIKCTPGAHLEVHVDAHLNAANSTRSYSVVDADQSGHVTIAVKAVENSRGGSRFMWTRKPGDVLRVLRPSNSFALSGAQHAHHVLFAGGIGVTPLVSMARALKRRGASMSMLYAARTRAEMAYLAELEDLLGENITALATDEGAMLDLKAQIAALPANAEVYMCGPIGLMDAVRHEWAAQGRQAQRLRFETFGSGGSIPTETFTVRIPRLNKEVTVPSDTSMLDALTLAGVPMISGCRKGECGLCVLDVVGTDGKLDHRDVFFSEEQKAHGKRICTCVSRVTEGSITVEPGWRGDPDLRKPEVLYEV